MELVVLNGCVHCSDKKNNRFVKSRGLNLLATLKNVYDRDQFEKRGRRGYLDYIERSERKEVIEEKESENE
jgi:hypothetical protein